MSTPGRKLLEGFTQLIYPNSCWVCGSLLASDQGTLCASCQSQLTHDPFSTCPRCASTVGPNLVVDQGCALCRNESYAFDGVFRMAPYDGLLREVILRMKTWTGEVLAEVIGAVWARTMAPRLAAVHADMVVPVPLHWTRCWRRGFNQSAILASCLGRELNIPSANHALRRLRRTGEQKRHNTGKARQDNVRHAFQADPRSGLENKTILLVDDVLTSGATASECARALKKQRATAVYVAVLAHGK